MNLRTFRIGGVHPEENKITAEMATQVAPLPKQAIFPLGQHIGAPAKPVVAKGDKVKVGTLIAEAGGFVSAPIYSSVSGTVFKVDTSIDATGYRKPCIIINVEGDEWEESIDRSDKLEILLRNFERLTQACRANFELIVFLVTVQMILNILTQGNTILNPYSIGMVNLNNDSIVGTDFNAYQEIFLILEPFFN